MHSGPKAFSALETKSRISNPMERSKKFYCSCFIKFGDLLETSMVWIGRCKDNKDPIHDTKELKACVIFSVNSLHDFKFWSVASIPFII